MTGGKQRSRLNWRHGAIRGSARRAVLFVDAVGSSPTATPDAKKLAADLVENLRRLEVLLAVMAPLDK